MLLKPYYTVQEASILTGISRPVITKMYQGGQIEGILRIGKAVGIPASWVEQFIVPDGYLPAPEAARRAGVTRAAMQKAVQAEKVDYIRRKYSRVKTFIFVNVENAKWNSWVADAQERSSRYSKM